MALPAGMVSAIWAVAMLQGADKAAAVELPPTRNLFDLIPAVLLVIAVMAMSLTARWTLKRFGDAGLVTTLVISGMIDVDAAIISISRLPKGVLTPLTAGSVLAAPVLANTMVKAGLAVAFARGRRGWRAAAPPLTSVAVGLLGLAMLPVLFGR